MEDWRLLHIHEVECLIFCWLYLTREMGGGGVGGIASECKMPKGCEARDGKARNKCDGEHDQQEREVIVRARGVGGQCASHAYKTFGNTHGDAHAFICIDCKHTNKISNNYTQSLAHRIERSPNNVRIFVQFKLLMRSRIEFTGGCELGVSVVAKISENFFNIDAEADRVLGESRMSHRKRRDGRRCGSRASLLSLRVPGCFAPPVDVVPAV